MKTVIKLLLNALAVLAVSELLTGVMVTNYITAIIVAIVLAILNNVVKPVLVVLTIPVTVFTMGLFLLIINAFIILLADKVVSGFEVKGVWWAIAFSILLSIVQSVLHTIIKVDKAS